VDTEAGDNRVFVRASRTAGTLTLRATANGLTAATVSIDSILVGSDGQTAVVSVTV
jgi:beta-galactosidase